MGQVPGEMKIIADIEISWNFMTNTALRKNNFFALYHYPISIISSR
jgi:hypothetical protein